MGLEKIVDYLRRELWEAEPQEVIRGMRDRVRRWVRLLYLAVRGFFHDGGVHRASELAFDSVLATVPLLAIVFSVLKGLGAYDLFVAETVRPWIDHTFGPGGGGDEATRSSLRDAFTGVLDLVESTEVSHLGIIGLVALLYVVLVLLSTVEVALNEIYGVRRPRTLVRRVADYAAILFTAPFILSVAAGAGSWVKGLPGTGPLLDVLTEIGLVLLVAGGLTFLYVVMPHRRVKPTSAMVGAVVGALLWYGALILHARFQIGVARYNAIYSGFAALPLFLIWVFLSWIGILIGAELAAVHEDEAEFRWRIKDVQPSEDVREVAALRMMIEVARVFVRADAAAVTRKDLARAARVPEGLARQVLAQLERQGLLAEATRNGRTAFVLPVDPAAVRITDVVGALRKDAAGKLPGVGRDRRVAARLEELATAMDQADANATLRELAEEWERRRAEDTGRQPRAAE
ncbi:MAG: YhjD/YihY/BrkB family envelope integrity protein [Myxococcota bacterium]